MEGSDGSGGNGMLRPKLNVKLGNESPGILGNVMDGRDGSGGNGMLRPKLNVKLGSESPGMTGSVIDGSDGRGGNGMLRPKLKLKNGKLHRLTEQLSRFQTKTQGLDQKLFQQDTEAEDSQDLEQLQLLHPDDRLWY